MRVGAQIDISASPEQVWEFIVDPERYLHFMQGITRWEVASDFPSGMGARYRMLMRIGAAEVGGLFEVVEYDEPRDMAWNNITGLDQRGRGRRRERSTGSHPARTQEVCRLTFGRRATGAM